MQVAWAGVGDHVMQIELPDPDVSVMPGVVWGRPEVPLTPAYWAVRCQWGDGVAGFAASDSTLREEVAFCLLGGFGITYEINVAAFMRLKSQGAFEPGAMPSEAWLLEELMRPLAIGDRLVRYRFPRQRARRLTSMSQNLADLAQGDLDALTLRNRLLALEGIGPKTASWIVRNFLGSDEVAILDIHIMRACRAMSVFPAEVSLPRDYEALEQRFLNFAKALNVRASVLDAVMWLEMRQGAPPAY